MNENRMNEVLAQIAGQNWKGPGTNERVERFILERKHAMSKKQKLTIAGIVIGASLVSAGLATAVTHKIVSQRFQFITEDGQVFEGEMITDIAPGQGNGTFQTDDGKVYEFYMEPDSALEPAKTSD